jgi:phosphoribosylanthranilate isomerase
MLSTKVVLLNVTNLSDARYAAGMGVDYIGFSINPQSNQFVTAADVNTITDWLSGVSLVGDLGSTLADHSEYKVDYLLTNNKDLVSGLDEPILSLDLSNENLDSVSAILANLKGAVSFFILKVAQHDIESLQSDIRRINSEFVCFISTEYDADSLKLVLDTKPKGIVLYGSHEEKPGLSNYDGIADVLEMLDEI